MSAIICKAKSACIETFGTRIPKNNALQAPLAKLFILSRVFLSLIVILRYEIYNRICNFMLLRVTFCGILTSFQDLSKRITHHNIYKKILEEFLRNGYERGLSSAP
jgi:hypothetical protein